jgi:hypothetical protein
MDTTNRDVQNETASARDCSFGFANEMTYVLSPSEKVVDQSADAVSASRWFFVIVPFPL